MAKRTEKRTCYQGKKVSPRLSVIPLSELMDPRILVFQDFSFSVFCKKSPDNREPITINWRAVRDRSPLRRPCWRRSGVDGMAHAATVNPVVLAGLLLGVVRLVSRTIERMAMGRIPHPIAAWRGRRARGGVAGNKRLARRGRGRRCRRSCGLRRRCLLSYGCRVYAADLINSIMK
jgi:hypothetical protein